MSLAAGIKRSYAQAFEQLAERTEPAKKAKIEETFPLEELPNELLDAVLSRLPALDLLRSCWVNKRFFQLGSSRSLWKTFDLHHAFSDFKVSVFDKKDWEVHADFQKLKLADEDISPIDTARAVREMAQLILRLKENEVSIEQDAGFTVMTLPKKLSRSFLTSFARDPKQGNKAGGFGWIDPKIEQVLQSMTVSKSYQLIITNSILNNSRDKTAEDQDKLLKKIGCTRPGVLEVASLVFFAYISSPSTDRVRLYASFKNEHTYTRARTEDDVRMLIGNFSRIPSDSPILGLYEDPSENMEVFFPKALTKAPGVGMAAVRLIS